MHTHYTSDSTYRALEGAQEVFFSFLFFFFISSYYIWSKCKTEYKNETAVSCSICNEMMGHLKQQKMACIGVTCGQEYIHFDSSNEVVYFVHYWQKGRGL